jgi:hypothetical protein
MNPIALGLIVLGMVTLLFGISSLMKNEKIKGMALSIVGLLAIVAPFLVSYFIAR